MYWQSLWSCPAPESSGAGVFVSSRQTIVKASSTTIVEVSSDDLSTDEPTKQLWMACAKPSQALTLVLAAVLKAGRLNS